MEDKSYEINRLIENIEIKLERKLNTPTDFDFLSSAIKGSINESVSTSTLKRLWGYVTYPHIPSITVLSILSRFLGYKDYEDFCLSLKDNQTADSSFLSNKQIKVSTLHEGDGIELTWKPDRYCRLVYLGKGRFKILSQRNSKLRAGDTFQTDFFCLGHPLYMIDLHRQEEVLPNYIAGKQKGIMSLRLLKSL